MSIFFGILYISFIVWNRLIRTRLPRDIFEEIDSFLLIIYFSLLISSLFVLIYSLREIFNIEPRYAVIKKLLEVPIISKIFSIVSEIIINYLVDGPKNLYEYLYKKIKIRPQVEYICNKIFVFDIEAKPYFIYGLLYSKYFLRLIVVFVFAIDVFYFLKFSYFYHFLPLLLIPLILDFFIHVIYDMAQKNRNIYNQWIIFRPEGNDWNLQLKKDNPENPLLLLVDQSNFLEILKFHGECWLRYTYTAMTIDKYYSLDKKHKPYINLFIYGLYSLGWFWILFNIYI